MNKNDKIEFFNENVESIVTSNSDFLAQVLIDNIGDSRIKASILSWPDEIKENIFDSQLVNIENTGYLNDLENSWDEFYEMYDGKFDEKHMLHITVHARFKNELEDLGYTKQDEEENWHKPNAGEYKYDDEGNLVIIHSCPDREIFEVSVHQYLEELSINDQWTSDATLSIM